MPPMACECEANRVRMGNITLTSHASKTARDMNRRVQLRRKGHSVLSVGEDARVTNTVLMEGDLFVTADATGRPAPCPVRRSAMLCNDECAIEYELRRTAFGCWGQGKPGSTGACNAMACGYTVVELMEGGAAVSAEKPVCLGHMPLDSDASSTKTTSDGEGAPEEPRGRAAGSQSRRSRVPLATAGGATGAGGSGSAAVGGSFVLTGHPKVSGAGVSGGAPPPPPPPAPGLPEDFLSILRGDKAPPGAATGPSGPSTPAKSGGAAGKAGATADEAGGERDGLTASARKAAASAAQGQEGSKAAASILAGIAAAVARTVDQAWRLRVEAADVATQISSGVVVEATARLLEFVATEADLLGVDKQELVEAWMEAQFTEDEQRAAEDRAKSEAAEAAAAAAESEAGVRAEAEAERARRDALRVSAPERARAAAWASKFAAAAESAEQERSFGDSFRLSRDRVLADKECREVPSEAGSTPTVDGGGRAASGYGAAATPAALADEFLGGLSTADRTVLVRDYAERVKAEASEGQRMWLGVRMLEEWGLSVRRTAVAVVEVLEAASGVGDVRGGGGGAGGARMELTRFEEQQLALDERKVRMLEEQREEERRELRMKEQHRATEAGLVGEGTVGTAISSLIDHEELLFVLRACCSGPSVRSMTVGSVTVEVPMVGMDSRSLNDVLLDVKRGLRDPDTLRKLKRLGFQSRLVNYVIKAILMVHLDSAHTSTGIDDRDFWIALDAGHVNARALERYYLLDGELLPDPARAIEATQGTGSGKAKKPAVYHMAPENMVCKRTEPKASGQAVQPKGLDVDAGNSAVYPYNCPANDPKLDGFKSMLLQMGITMTYVLNVDFLGPLLRVGEAFGTVVSTLLEDEDTDDVLHFLVGCSSLALVRLFRRMLGAFEARLRDRYRVASTVAARHGMQRSPATTMRVDLYSRSSASDQRNHVTEARDYAFGFEPSSYVLTQIKKEIEQRYRDGIKQQALGTMSLGAAETSYSEFVTSGMSAMLSAAASPPARLGAADLPWRQDAAREREKAGGEPLLGQPLPVLSSSRWVPGGKGPASGRSRSPRSPPRSPPTVRRRKLVAGEGLALVAAPRQAGDDATPQACFDNVVPEFQAKTVAAAVKLFSDADGNALCLAFASHVDCTELRTSFERGGALHARCVHGEHSLSAAVDPSVGALIALAARQGCRLSGSWCERFRSAEDARSYASGLWALARTRLLTEPAKFRATGAAHVLLSELGAQQHARLLLLQCEARRGRCAMAVELVAETEQNAELSVVRAALVRHGLRCGPGASVDDINRAIGRSARGAPLLSATAGGKVVFQRAAADQRRLAIVQLGDQVGGVRFSQVVEITDVDPADNVMLFLPREGVVQRLCSGDKLFEYSAEAEWGSHGARRFVHEEGAPITTMERLRELHQTGAQRPEAAAALEVARCSSGDLGPPEGRRRASLGGGGAGWMCAGCAHVNAQAGALACGKCAATRLPWVPGAASNAAGAEAAARAAGRVARAEAGSAAVAAAPAGSCICAACGAERDVAGACELGLCDTCRLVRLAGRRAAGGKGGVVSVDAPCSQGGEASSMGECARDDGRVSAPRLVRGRKNQPSSELPHRADASVVPQSGVVDPGAASSAAGRSDEATQSSASPRQQQNAAECAGGCAACGGAFEPQCDPCSDGAGATVCEPCRVGGTLYESDGDPVLVEDLQEVDLSTWLEPTGAAAPHEFSVWADEFVPLEKPLESLVNAAGATRSAATAWVFEGFEPALIVGPSGVDAAAMAEAAAGSPHVPVQIGRDPALESARASKARLGRRVTAAGFFEEMPCSPLLRSATRALVEQDLMDALGGATTATDAGIDSVDTSRAALQACALAALRVIRTRGVHADAEELYDKLGGARALGAANVECVVELNSSGSLTSLVVHGEAFDVVVDDDQLLTSSGVTWGSQCYPVVLADMAGVGRAELLDSCVGVAAAVAEREGFDAAELPECKSAAWAAVRESCHDWRNPGHEKTHQSIAHLAPPELDPFQFMCLQVPRQGFGAKLQMYTGVAFDESDVGRLPEVLGGGKACHRRYVAFYNGHAVGLQPRNGKLYERGAAAEFVGRFGGLVASTVLTGAADVLLNSPAASEMINVHEGTACPFCRAVGRGCAECRFIRPPTKRGEWALAGGDPPRWAGTVRAEVSSWQYDQRGLDGLGGRSRIRAAVQAAAVSAASDGAARVSGGVSAMGGWATRAAALAIVVAAGLSGACSLATMDGSGVRAAVPGGGWASPASAAAAGAFEAAGGLPTYPQGGGEQPSSAESDRNGRIGGKGAVVEAAAQRLIDFYRGTSSQGDVQAYDPAKFLHVAHLGDQLIAACDGYVAAAEAFREAWVREWGCHLDAGRIEGLDGLDPELKAFLASVARDGVPSNSSAPAVRLRGGPGPSVEEHMAEYLKAMWKDSVKGRLLVCTEASGSWLGDVSAHNVHRVPKRMAGLVLDEGRFISDMRRQNVFMPKESVHTVVLPTLKEVARRIVQMVNIFPGVRMLIGKRDVASAFKLINLRPQDCGQFATELPGVHIGAPAEHLHILFLCLTFGASVSPGHYHAYSMGIHQYHNARGPPNPAWNGNYRYWSTTLVDDGILIEMDQGDRVALSGDTYDLGTQMLLGPFSQNWTKWLEEGAMGPTSLVWGMLTDVTDIHLGLEFGFFSMPATKLAALQRFFDQEVFAWGNKRVGIHDMQCALGNCIYVCSVNCTLLTELPVLARCLCTESLEQVWVSFRGTEEEQQRCWEETWACLECVRLLVRTPSLNKIKFTSPLLRALAPAEIMSLPGAKQTWIGGDANMNGCGAIDWTNNRYDYFATSCFLPLLRELCNDEDTDVIIFNLEMLSYVVAACKWGHLWSGTLVIVVTDNMNVAQGINQGRTNNRFSNHLLRIFRLFCSVYSFDMTAAYIYTHHNLLADTLSRVFDVVSKMEVLEAELPQFMLENHPQLVRDSLVEVAQHVLSKPWAKRSYEMPGLDTNQVAAEMAEARQQFQAKTEERARTGEVRSADAPLLAVDFFSGTGALASAGQARGVTTLGRCEVDDEIDWLYGLECPSALRSVDFYAGDWWAWARARPELVYFTPSCQNWTPANRGEKGFGAPDGRGSHFYDIVNVFQRLPSALVGVGENVQGVVKWKGGAIFEHWRDTMKAVGVNVFVSLVNATDYGVPQARNRVIFRAERCEVTQLLGEPEALCVADEPAPRLRGFLSPVESVPDVCWSRVPGQRIVRGVYAAVRGTEGPRQVGELILPGGVDQPVYAGAVVRFSGGGVKETWRALRQLSDSSWLFFRAGEKHKIARFEGAVEYVHEQQLALYSIDGVAAPVKAWGEPPAGPGTVMYLDDRGGSDEARALMAVECWDLQGKMRGTLQRWCEASRAGTAGVPPYHASNIHKFAGLSMPQPLADAAVDWGVRRVHLYKQALAAQQAVPEGTTSLGAREQRTGEPAFGASDAAWRRPTLEALWRPARDLAMLVLRLLSSGVGLTMVAHGAACWLMIVAAASFGASRRARGGSRWTLWFFGLLLSTCVADAMPRGPKRAPGLSSRAVPPAVPERVRLAAERDPGQHRSLKQRQQDRRVLIHAGVGVLDEDLASDSRVNFGLKMGTGLMENAVCSGTKGTYAAPWKHWQCYRELQGEPVYMVGGTHAECQRDEESMLCFLGIEASEMGLSYSTVKGAFSAIRHHHIIGGYPDPLVGKPRYRMALSAVRRYEGAISRKIPTTPEMLVFLSNHLDLNSPEGATEFAAVMVSWFYLLRASEYVALDSGIYDTGKALRVQDIMPRAGGRYVHDWSIADETVCFLRGSKVDKYNQGEVRNIEAGVANGKIDATWAMRNLHRVRPELQMQPENFLFCYPAGSKKLLGRRRIQLLLKTAALACNIPKHLVGSHSQRSGGATALWQAGYSIDYIKRFGRWTSDCVQLYLWDGQERTAGVADAMASVRYTLHTEVLEQRRLGVEVARGMAARAGRPPMAPARQ